MAFLGVAVAALAFAGSAYGQAKPAAKPAAAKAAPKGKLDVKENTAALQSTESARIETAIVNIRMAGKEGGGKALTAALVARVKSGLPKELLKKALETLGELEDPAAFEGCEMYLAHRESEVRSTAVRCAGSSHAPGTNKALRAALADIDPRVHALAATLLGEAKATDSVDDLIVALDKNVNEAAVSIGMLCDTKNGQCDQLLNRMKSKPLDVIFSGLSQLLVRKDVPDDFKKKVITQVRELASAKAREFLESVKKTWPKDGSKPVAEALDKAIKDLEGAK